MSLKEWANHGWLKTHKTSPQEINNLLQIVDRDLTDAEGGVSTDWRFGIAYNAALKLCTILLYAEGFRPERALHHYRTIQTLPLILGQSHTQDAQFLETCRAKRNTLEYEYVGGITEDGVVELIDFVKEFKTQVIEWLKENHPQLVKKHGS